MRPGRVRWLIAGVVAVVTAGICLGVWLNRAPGRASAPVVNRVQVRVMLPAITAYLQSAAYRDRNGEYPPAAYQAEWVRWLCNARIVEIRPEGAQWRVGMDVACGDYARRSNKVFMDDGGDMGHEVMILSGGRGRYRVLSAAQEPGVTLTRGGSARISLAPPLLRSTAAKRRWRRGRPSRFCGHSAVSQVPPTAR